MRFSPRSAALLLILTVAAPAAAPAQWVTTPEQTYLPARWNWQFLRWYPSAGRLFNAFDYGHAILYETLWRHPDAPASRLEQREYDHLVTRVLARPPRLPLEESAIEVEYAKLVPEAKLMFEWAHVLHRQIYDVWADERLTLAQKDAAIATLLRYYRSRPDLAFSARPKSMMLMEGQPYSLAFRRGYPKFNGLIWAYHWLQVGLYDALMAGADASARQANVGAAVARFWQMIDDAPARMPRLMPMTAVVAPRFAARYPEAAIIFDNLHGMHDVISDILANPVVPRDGKRAAIIAAARAYRDDTTAVTTVAEWREMSEAMGVQNMGGVAVGFSPDLPKPTVPLGASHMDVRHGGMRAPADTGHAAGHAAPSPTEPSAAPHAGHEVPSTSGVAPDTTHGAHAAPAPKPAATKTTPTKRSSAPTTKPAPAKPPAPATKKPDPHAGHGVHQP